MAEAASESADADTDEERIERPWAQQTPKTRVTGTITGVFYAGQLDEGTAQNDTSFGIVLEDAEVVEGTLYVNEEKPSDGTTADGVGDNQPRPTDYRIVDEDDRDTTIANGAFVTDENGPNTYEEADGFGEDAVIVWYNGLSGQRIGRVLDFNGQPFAKWTDDPQDPYLVKGLLQPAAEWPDANSDRRSEMAQNGLAPRIARAPVFRERVDVIYDDEGSIEEITVEDEGELDAVIDISRWNGGRGYEVHVFDDEEFVAEHGSLDAELPRDSNNIVDSEAEVDMRYQPLADEVLEQVGYRMHMHTGAGWQDQPANWEPESTSSVGSFGISADTDDGEGGFSAEHEAFVEEIVGELSGSGMTPEEAFSGGLAALIGKKEDMFSRVPDVDEVRREVYARLDYLDSADLDE